jgi:ubiquinone/menaquinone biosynthesis C-methylase UbiE
VGDDVFAAVKQRQRASWAAGDWDEVAELIAEVGPKLLDRIGIERDLDVLDVGTGTGGNVAIPAAQRGARVVGCDLTPELLEHARRRAAAAGVEVEWLEADAEALPFEPDRFDRVISTFGHIFAPRHAVAAAELARVCRPDGVIAFTSWTPASLPGRIFRILGSYLPPPPEGVEGPVSWGDETHVREMFEPHGLQLAFERHIATFEFDDVDTALAFHEQKFGGLVLARGMLEPQGRWDDLRGELEEVLRESEVSPGGRVRLDSEYLETVATQRASNEAG